MPQIPCKEIAQKIINSLRLLPAPKKTLAAVLVKGNSASASFIKQKDKVAAELGINFCAYELPENISQGELVQKVNGLVAEESIGGIIIQLPLPEQLNSQEILNLIPAEKDVDVLGEQALKNFSAGQNKILPPPVGVVKEIFKTYNLKPKTLKMAIIGTGRLVGKPISVWLENKTAKLSILNSKTKNIKEELKDADIIISGAGKANLFSVDDIKENAIVIDFGYSTVEGKISGDFNPNSPIPQSSNSLTYTPTPGGTGPILVAKIMENFYNLNNE
ncbi:MAG: bifunctional 5,10-methylenetetrahydrofolate dehydrogenase/5,10-methenyltetrahydrofolate cyclohydrolase [Candidatus Paceibacterota bacterium]